VSSARPKVSIVICYNSLDQYGKAIGYIDTQSIREEIEIVGVDNTGKRFPSAAKALNSGASAAMGEIIVFMHQDLYLIERDAIEKIYLRLASTNKPTLLGVAGYLHDEEEVIFNLYHFEERIQRAKRFDAERLYTVETVDECLVACRKEVWERYRFDEDTCDNWHFYAVDLSYQIALDAGTVVVYPLALWHYSGGVRNEEFYIGLCRMCGKYRGKLKRINSTCLQCRTTFWSCHYLLLKYEVSEMVGMVARFLLRADPRSWWS
jgi:glycosyltransferase involved in cell wall biosynthesis